MSLKVYGIPNCGTCKKALAWLDKNGIAYEFIDTKVHTPSQPVIAQWVAELGSKPMRNTSGQSYRALGNAKTDWSEAQWVEAFAQDAMLLKRPLFEKAGKAVLVGFRAKEAELQSLLA
jgi:arsenate reductase (glutaredoxin)